MRQNKPEDKVQREACLQYAGTLRAVAFEDAAPIAEVMRRIAPTWPTVPPSGDVIIEARPDGDRYELTAPWFDEPVRGLTPVSAACSIFVDVARLVLEAEPSLLCLHAAAFELSGGLVVLCGTSRAGKSTLATRLADGPGRLFCDDILPLDANGRGIALGVAPRLRLPLPATANDAFASFCAAHVVASDERYGYVLPPTLAPHGAQSPLRAIVILDRREDGPAGLVPASKAEAIHHLVRRNLARHDGAAAILDRLARLGQSLVAVRLYYSDIDEAADLIHSAFDGTAPLELRSDDYAAGAQLERDSEIEAAHDKLDPIQTWRARAEVGIRTIDGVAFLTGPMDDAIYELNETGLACWRVLVEFGGSVEQLAELLAIAYPSAGRAQLLADVTALLTALHRNGLVEVACH